MVAIIDQTVVFEFLEDPASHGQIEPVKRIDTHGAVVFLAGRDVYKVKRAVRYPYMDFSTLEKRKAACDAEIAVNRDTAPDLYLGVIPITQGPEGLRLGGAGEIVEWAVHLRRFDEQATFDHIAERGPLGTVLVSKLAKVIEEAHRLAECRNGSAAVTSLRSVLVNTLLELRQEAQWLPATEIALLDERLTAAFATDLPLLTRRSFLGKVRRCHGDLHLGNIALIGGEPVLFDALEFDEALAATDILYDVAYALMDLCTRGLGEDANLLLNRYLWLQADIRSEIEGLALLPMFLSLRAAIRAKVLSAQMLIKGDENLRDAALRHVIAARRFLDGAPPRLIAVGGLSGAGKSSFAAALAPKLGQAPGALHLRSDIERKRLFAAAEATRLPAQSYEAGPTRLTYERLGDLARAGVEAGRTVIVDATWQRAEDREAIEAVARNGSVDFIGLWLDAPLSLRLRRVARRGADASDATAGTLRAQSMTDTGPLTWKRLDASRDLSVLMRDQIVTEVSGKR